MLQRQWPVPSDAIAFDQAASIEVQIVGTPSAPYVPKRSLDSATPVTCNAYDKDGNATSSISAAGLYLIEGGAFVSLTGGGTGAVVFYRAGE